MTGNPEDFETVAEPISAISHVPAFSHERFPPGALLASRYRIISRLGKGGMGEVFRADDLILRQPVALKFLPESAKNNINLLTRFYDEVRIARQISHRNVCRVYDIGEVDGQPYLSMEYIDGEDLGCLLRRIGRLPSDKATEFARKLCAGVAAAHAQGVLHRDLKPANIMIDARGELRVTDFGLAAIAEQLNKEEIRSGTPAYMAPEQLAGLEVSPQSDLYAVGLILYEMFTGKMPFEADTIAEITRLRQENRVTSPSSLAKDLDKAVESAILRCLESDPKMRPASALALSAMLPGGDPLAAALADGLTPSPEVVAEAGSHEALPPKVAVPALAGIIVGLAVFCLAIPYCHLMNLIPMENPPEVLRAKAREILKTLGYNDRAADATGNFYGDGPMFSFLRSKGHSMQEWSRLFSQPPSAVGYWYRQAPVPLVAQSTLLNGKPAVGDPPTDVPGMITVVMDLDGSLRRFVAVPPEHQVPPALLKPPDWTRLFAAANLDIVKFSPAEAPEWSSGVMSDARAAWKGFYRDRPDLPVRVEAAAFLGKPVYFRVLWPWLQGSQSAAQSSTRTLRSYVNFAIEFCVFIAALWIAHYNWKARRADLRGATRVAIVCGVTSLISWIFHAHHVASEAEQILIRNALANSAYLGVLYWLLYLALEPWVRRYWPQSMITWSRIVAGKWNDPMVGRDLLFGTFFGVIYVLVLMLYEYSNLRSGTPIIGQFFLDNLNGFRPFADFVTSQVSGEVGGALTFLLTLFLVRAIFRKQWIVAVVWVAGWVAVRFLRANFIDSPELAITTGIFWVLLFSLLVVIILRFGFFALVVAVYMLDLIVGCFLTTDFSAWYGVTSLGVVLLTLLIAFWGFRLSLGSRPLFSPAALERT